MALQFPRPTIAQSMRSIPLFLLLLFCTSVSTAQKPQIPENWRARVDDQVHKTSAFMEHHAYVLESETKILNKKGEVKEIILEVHRVHTGPDGETIREELDESGNVVDVEIEEKEDTDDIGATVEGEVQLLSVFELDKQNLHHFKNIEIDKNGFLHVAFEPVNPEDEAGTFLGRAWIDTSSWAIARIKVTPMDVPNRVKKLNMDAQFVPDASGTWLPTSITSNVHAKLLLFNIYTETTQQFLRFEEI